MLGKTNAVAGSGGSGGGGDVINVSNQSGGDIITGQKVWISSDAKSASEPILVDTRYGTGSYAAILSHSGNYLVAMSTLYQVTDTNKLVTLDNVSSIYPKHTMCLVDGFICQSASSEYYNVLLKENKTRSISGSRWPVANTSYFTDNKQGNAVSKYNLETGELDFNFEVIKPEGQESNLLYKTNTPMFVIGNKFYSYNPDNHVNWVFDIDEEARTLIYSGNFVFPWEDCKFLGMTNDNKHLILATKYDQLRIAENMGNNVFRGLNEDEVPSELIQFYISSGYFYFNANNQVLCCCNESNNSKNFRYVFMQYGGNSKWVNLNLQFEIPDSSPLTGGFYTGLTISDDLSRVLVPYYYNSSWSGSSVYFYNTTTLGGYSAYNFDINRITSTSFTGIAKEDATAGESFEVEVLLPSRTTLTVTTNADNADISLEL